MTHSLSRSRTYFFPPAHTSCVSRLDTGDPSTPIGKYIKFYFSSLYFSLSLSIPAPQWCVSRSPFPQPSPDIKRTYKTSSWHRRCLWNARGIR